MHVDDAFGKLVTGSAASASRRQLIAAIERHGHFRLDDDVRQLVLRMSAATIDRLLKPVRDVAKQGRRRVTISTPRRKSIAVRTFNDWNDPEPSYFEIDMVAHCGKPLAGSHVHSLVMTDIASGWTEATAMVVREQSLLTLTIEGISRKLPFPVLGLAVDNDSAFINRTVVDYCAAQGIELTRYSVHAKRMLRVGSSKRMAQLSGAWLITEGWRE